MPATQKKKTGIYNNFMFGLVIPEIHIEVRTLQDFPYTLSLVFELL